MEMCVGHHEPLNLVLHLDFIEFCCLDLVSVDFWLQIKYTEAFWKTTIYCIEMQVGHVEQSLIYRS
jgi:hypothetical protein